MLWVTSIKSLFDFYKGFFTVASVRKLGQKQNTLIDMVFSLLVLVYFRFILIPRVAFLVPQPESLNCFWGPVLLSCPWTPVFICSELEDSWKLFPASVLLSCHSLSHFSACEPLPNGQMSQGGQESWIWADFSALQDLVLSRCHQKDLFYILYPSFLVLHS